MNSKNRVFNKLLFITSLVFLFAYSGSGLQDLQPKAYAEPVISQESIDFITKTGQAMAEISEAVKPAVVNISTSRTEKSSENPLTPFSDDPFFRRFFDDMFKNPDRPRERKIASLGSGVIVSDDGYILTNNHVVRNADEIQVLLSDKRTFQGKIIGTDSKTDLSVIKIDATDLPTISWGDSDKLKVGEIVLAIGNPFGLDQTVTMGIVSAVGRANLRIADYEDFIQTDAAINPGNSGGAMVNARGRLVGINTAIFSKTGGYQGIGFAIPSNMAKAVIESLISKGKVVRGWLGVSVQTITPELARQFNLHEDLGALVGDVVEDSPAEKAGIMRGDVIIEFKGKKVDEPFNLRNAVASIPPGEMVDLKVIRDGRVKTLIVEIGELEAEVKKTAPTSYKNALKGVSVQNLTPEIYRQLNLSEKTRGVVVSAIKSGSPAGKGMSSVTKLKTGDVIIEIKGKAITGLKDYDAVVSKIQSEEEVLLLISRKGKNLYITISPE